MTYLEPIQKAGFRLSLEGNKLLVEPFSRLSPRQRQFIRRHKAEIIQELTAANETGDRLTMRRCDTCRTETLHQRIEGQWQCTRRHPAWPRFDDSGRTGPVVECWSPSGRPIRIKARDLEHAEWLRRMNPPPESGTKSNGEGR